MAEVNSVDCARLVRESWSSESKLLPERVQVFPEAPDGRRSRCDLWCAVWHGR